MKNALITMSSIALPAGLAYQQGLGIAIAAGSGVATIFAITFFQGLLNKAWTKANPNFEQIKQNYTFRRITAYCALAVPVVAHALRYFTPLVVPTAVTALGAAGLLTALMVTAQLRRHVVLPEPQEEQFGDGLDHDQPGPVNQEQPVLPPAPLPVPTQDQIEQYAALVSGGNPDWDLIDESLGGKIDQSQELITMESEGRITVKVPFTEYEIRTAGNLRLPAHQPIKPTEQPLQSLQRQLSNFLLKSRVHFYATVAENLMPYLSSLPDAVSITGMQKRLPLFEGKQPTIFAGDVTMTIGKDTEDLIIERFYPVYVEGHYLGTFIIHQDIPLNDLTIDKGRTMFCFVTPKQQ
jgi:hypothetical protein